MNSNNKKTKMPASWEQAHAWVDDANGDKIDYSEPLWSFDCGLKLNFDGPLLYVSSRFYPPGPIGGFSWDGDVKILLGDKVLENRKFDCSTLDTLRSEVEEYVKDVNRRLKKAATTWVLTEFAK